MRSLSFQRPWFIYPAITIFIFILDQFSKWIVMTGLFMKDQALALYKGASNEQDLASFPAWLLQFESPHPRLPPYELEVLPFFNLVMVWNEGVSFGLFSGSGEWRPLALSLVSLVICGVLCVWAFAQRRGFPRVIAAIVTGGALGNVFDRLRFGAVADFFDFHLANWHYPAFNIADSAIVAGIACLAFDALLSPVQGKVNQDAAPPLEKL